MLLFDSFAYDGVSQAVVEVVDLALDDGEKLLQSFNAPATPMTVVKDKLA